MNSEAARVRREIDQQRFALRRAETDLAVLERSCAHVWSEPKYDPTHTQEWVSGHGPRYMGVDFVGYEHNFYADKPHPRWSRECSKCGKLEYTTQKRDIVRHEPVF